MSSAEPLPRGLSHALRGYVRSRVAELALPATRAVGEPLASWALRRIRLEGRPFSFEGHAYLREIYDDTAAHVVLCKAAQIGGTTWAILRAIHACAMGLNVMYFFPTRTDVLEFSKSRVGPLLADNRFLARLMNDTDTAGLKRIGNCYLYLRGMQSTVGMKSVPADMLVFDEVDEAPPEAKSLARERLAHSNYKRIVELSNPTLPDYGIDEAYRHTGRHVSPSGSTTSKSASDGRTPRTASPCPKCSNGAARRGCWRAPTSRARWASIPAASCTWSSPAGSTRTRKRVRSSISGCSTTTGSWTI